MLAWAQEDVAQQYVGRPVAEILDTLRSEGTNLAYSTNLVTSDLLVQTEPELGEPLDVARQILEPHGLTIRTESGVHLVVRDKQAVPVKEPAPETTEPDTG